MPSFDMHQPNSWLGTPRTAQYTTPITAGLVVADQPTLREAMPLTTSFRIRGGNVINPGSAATVGITGLVCDSRWVAGQWTNSSTTFTDDTTDAQDADTGDFQYFNTVDNTGFVIQSLTKFDVFTLEVTVAANSATVAYAYWGQPTSGIVGTAGWQTFTPVVSPTLTTTGEKLFVTGVPDNCLTALVAGDFTGAKAGYYAIRVMATTAPTTTTGTASRVYVGREYYRDLVGAASGSFGIAGGIGAPHTRWNGMSTDGIVAIGYYTTVTNVGNQMYLEYE